MREGTVLVTNCTLNLGANFNLAMRATNQVRLINTCTVFALFVFSLVPSKRSLVKSWKRTQVKPPEKIFLEKNLVVQ